MAQGKGKIKKATAPKKHHKKALGPKKGARTIAPKKKTTVKAAKVKKMEDRRTYLQFCDGFVAASGKTTLLQGLEQAGQNLVTMLGKEKGSFAINNCLQALEVTIKANIEEQLTQVAVSKQSKPLKMVKPAAGKPPAKKKGGAKKKK